MTDPAGPTIGILVCDHVAPELRGAAGGLDYDGMYSRFLTEGGIPEGTTFRAYDVVGGELPGDPAECDAWIITGARFDAFGDEPWIAALRDLVVALRDVRARTVGICFGHQVLAQALGGTVERATEWKAGPQLLDVEPTAWFDGGRVHLNAMHRDAVTELPPGAMKVGEGATGVYPAFLVDDVMLGIQDHPEFDAAYTAALTEWRRHLMGSDVADAAFAELRRTPTDGDVVARWVVDFLLGFEVRRPSARRS
jgi:GMP synthase-like glutamine amidotransferase